MSGEASNGSWVGSIPHGRPMPITQYLLFAHDGLVLFHTSFQQLKQRVLFIQVNGRCDLKHIDGGSSNTNLSLGRIRDINLVRVRQCLFTDRPKTWCINVRLCAQVHASPQVI